MNKILVPIDGSKQADEAINYAMKIAEEEEAEVKILHVVERRPTIFGPYPYTNTSIPWLMGYPGYIYPEDFPEWARENEEEFQEYSKDYFTQVLKQIKLEKSEKVEVTYQIVPGKPAEKILEISEKEAFDSIVMGSTGLGSVGRFLLGGTSSRVKANSNIPVKIINEKGEEVEPEEGLLS